MSIQAPVGQHRTITVTAFNGASPPLKIFGGTLPRRKIGRGRANQPRDHAGTAIHGYCAKGRRWDWHCDILPGRHRLRRHLPKPISRGHDGLTERSLGTWCCVCRLERCVFGYGTLQRDQQCHRHGTLYCSDFYRSADGDIGGNGSGRSLAIPAGYRAHLPVLLILRPARP